MKVNVRFRFNKVTGEVELFQVDDEGPMVLSVDEHNRLHDRIAAELGSVLERNPHVIEVLPGAEVGKEVAPAREGEPGEATENTEQPASQPRERSQQA